MGTLVAAVALVAVMSACGGGSDDSSAAADAPSDQAGSDEGGDGVSAEGGCGVITEDDVATAADVTVYGSSELPTGCQWSISGDDPMISYEWQATVTEGFAANREIGETDSSYELTDIDGLGDEAFLRTTVNGAGDTQTGETWVRTGDEVFFVRTAAVAWSSDVEQAEFNIAQEITTALG